MFTLRTIIECSEKSEFDLLSKREINHASKLYADITGENEEKFADSESDKEKENKVFEENEEVIESDEAEDEDIHLV